MNLLFQAAIVVALCAAILSHARFWPSTDQASPDPASRSNLRAGATELPEPSNPSPRAVDAEFPDGVKAQGRPQLRGSQAENPAQSDP